MIRSETERETDRQTDRGRQRYIDVVSRQDGIELSDLERLLFDLI